MSDGLEREFRHLRDLEYVEVATVRAIPARGPDLSEYVSPIERGREFVDLRRELDATRAAASGTGRPG